MINARKVELMSKVALYENSQKGKRNLKLDKIHRAGSKGVFNLKNVFVGLLICALVLFLVAFTGFGLYEIFYEPEKTLAIVIEIVAACTIFVVAYVILSSHAIEMEYGDVRNELRGYELNLKRLEDVYAKEKENQPRSGNGDK